MGEPLPVSRQLGRATGRWWRRVRPGVTAASRPVRHGWAVIAGYAWMAAYLWIGLLLSVTGERLTGRTSPLLLLAAVGGGGMIGVWQARYRVRRHLDPATPPPRRMGLALMAWLAAIAATILLSLP